MTPLPPAHTRLVVLLTAGTVLLASCSQTEPSASHDPAGSTPATSTARPSTSPPAGASPELVPAGRKGTPKAGAINPHQVSGHDAKGTKTP